MSHYPMTSDKIRENIQKRIGELESELSALKGVKIDTNHKVLTNRAISGQGAVLRNASYSMHDKDDKELSISYYVETSEGGKRYENRTIVARVFTGTVTGILKDIRPMTPGELNDQLTDIKDGLASTIGDLRAEYKKANSIAKKHNTLVEKINEFNNNLSYACEAKI